ncbi:MAG: hypothetical protein LBM93_04590 [Oscillospiraceae bacterium]|jgi:hypothetical protein|nr:hypothetical protein [Oscillospiraceae bacterium]
MVEDAAKDKVTENKTVEGSVKRLKVKVGKENIIESIEEDKQKNNRDNVSLNKEQLSMWLQIAQSEYFNYAEIVKNLRERVNWILVSFMVVFVFLCGQIDFNIFKEMNILSKVMFLYLFVFITFFTFKLLSLSINIINVSREPGFDLSYLKKEEMKLTGTLELIGHYKKCSDFYNYRCMEIAEKINDVMKFFSSYIKLIFFFVILNKI